jgi:para-aminobenzoate synthetase component 1
MSQLVQPMALDQWLDPEALHHALSTDEPMTFWLDAGPDARDGWSWVGIGDLEVNSDRVGQVPAARQDASGDHPAGPFAGGWVGWFGYDRAADAAGAPAASADPLVPQDLWMRARAWFAFDHYAQTVWLWANDDDRKSAHTAAARAQQKATAGPRRAAPVTAQARNTPAEYEAMIGACRAAIGRGDAYQLCLTTRFDVATIEIDPREVYARLRRATPAHHGGLLIFGDVALASASPERFLEIGDGVVRTRPIKGTRPRGVDPAHDAALADELRASVKERAENVMIVDLMRNDLSQVCVPGSVTVEDLLSVESYPAVHQLVSTIAGRVRPGITLADVLRAAFPAGSMTGAPKLSAMTILNALEGQARGVFAGCFGWVGDDGSTDLAMIIRSIVMHPAGAYVGAGGGITWRSVPLEEVAEVAVKARGPLAALGATLPPGWVDAVG